LWCDALWSDTYIPFQTICCLHHQGHWIPDDQSSRVPWNFCMLLEVVFMSHLGRQPSPQPRPCKLKPSQKMFGQAQLIFELEIYLKNNYSPLVSLRLKLNPT
jgi:hypothetical protein